MGACAKLFPPRKSLLVVKNVMAGISSRMRDPQAFDTPISGLKDERLVPTFRSLVESYWPSGAVTRRLTPTMRSCRYVGKSSIVSAGAPYTLTDSGIADQPARTLAAPVPVPASFALPETSANGTTASTLPDSPHTSPDRG